MSTHDPIRAALERLIARLDETADPDGPVPAWVDSYCAARAALAGATSPPHAEGEPSDQELYDYWIATSPELGCADPVGFARAVLARWGRPATPPAPVEGEVGKLVVDMRSTASGLESHFYPQTAALIYRDAALLEQYQGSVKSAPSLTIAPAPPVVPIPVSERLPGGWDCDAGGSCWIWTADDVDGVGHWSYSHRDWAQEGDVTHWLPAHALPLPAPQGGEVEG